MPKITLQILTQFYYSEGMLVGMGNPLLDISAVCEESYLTK